MEIIKDTVRTLPGRDRTDVSGDMSQICTVDSETSASSSIEISMNLKTDENDKDEPLPMDTYEVEKILDHRELKNFYEYFVKWKGYAESENTWEPIDNLLDCRKTLTDYYLKVRKRAKKELGQGASNDDEMVKTKRRKTSSKARLPPDPRPVLDICQEYFLKNPMSEEDKKMEVELKNKIFSKLEIKKWKDSTVLKAMENEMMGKPNEEPRTLKKKVIILNICQQRKIQLTKLTIWENKMNLITKNCPKISVENNVDFTGPPKGFSYIDDYKLGEEIYIDNNPPFGCSHGDSNQGNVCHQNALSCKRLHDNLEFPYTTKKILRVTEGTGIFECHKGCKCGAECSNRVVQDGKSNLKGRSYCIFRTNNGRGWGLKTLKDIKRGEFLGLYVGEIIGTEEAERRGSTYDNNGNTYLFDLDFNVQDTCPYTVDAYKFGNFSHYINHSCDPNAAVFAVWVDCLDVNLPKLALFSRCAIKKGEEITFDYAKKMNDVDRINATGSLDPQSKLKPVRKPCKCGSDKCRGNLF